ncbi:hypothetical protein TRFO_18761 [Tritrichomonas foetus]|uniref:RRM domain-containing protein n=1 Tax=Tritrichomonas foetus TaxID=1144522 RepID=A0A1J4KPR9_9EUKA|nr:hypothetical protein TRFO_18761 [Tritrichomonas foetus]|eukprot:OHT11702.1 hypothetical protein TRFO_18761 [Tritrichomonas foetus]
MRAGVSSLSDKDTWDMLLETPPFHDLSATGSMDTLPSICDVQEEEDDYMSGFSNIPSPLISVSQPTDMSVLTYLEPTHDIFVQYPNYQVESVNFDLQFHEIESRTILMSNIPPEATEQDLSAIFEKFGQVESYDISNIKKCIASVNFYDLRSAMLMRLSSIFLNSKQIITGFGQELPVIDKRKPPNNGTIVVFHLSPKMSDQTLCQIFSLYGQIRQIRSTPSKDTQKFIEFWDKRAAYEALKKQNGCYIDGSKISLEFSLPGGFKRSIQKYYTTHLPTIERRNVL